jgi:hypothetical protein
MSIAGRLGKLYYSSTAGSAPSEIEANEMKNVKNATLTLGSALADITTRGSNGHQSQKPVQSNWEISFDMENRPTDGDVVAVLDAYLAKSAIAILALDQDGGEGPNADFYVSQCDRGEPLDGTEVYSVTLVPTDENRAINWHLGSTSSLA